MRILARLEQLTFITRYKMQTRYESVKTIFWVSFLPLLVLLLSTLVNVSEVSFLLSSRWRQSCWTNTCVPWDKQVFEVFSLCSHGSPLNQFSDLFSVFFCFEIALFFIAFIWSEEKAFTTRPWFINIYLYERILARSEVERARELCFSIKSREIDFEGWNLKTTHSLIKVEARVRN